MYVNTDKNLFSRLDELGSELAILQLKLSGDPTRQRMNESTTPSIRSRIGQVIYGHWDTRQNPTATQMKNIEIAQKEFESFSIQLNQYLDKLSSYENDIEQAGAPWTPGRRP